ncbi:MAG: protoporphyrinogen oxidase HemJ [Hyphomicrobiaceae bacterium]
MAVDTSILQTPGGRAGMALVTTVVLAGGAILVFGGQAYAWIKAIHVIAVMSWMAGMLYLPRLFVYHSEAGPVGEPAATFVVMERRLLQIIMTPAMVISWGLGLWLAWDGGHLASGWFHGKLLAVVGMTAAHGYLAGAAKKFAAGEIVGSTRYWRLMNEVPTVLMVVAVILVVVQPF